MIKAILSVTFATALMGLVAYGQTSTSSTTATTGTNGATETTTTTTESTGTVTEFTPGHHLFRRTEATAQLVQYKLRGGFRSQEEMVARSEFRDRACTFGCRGCGFSRSICPRRGGGG